MTNYLWILQGVRDGQILTAFHFNFLMVLCYINLFHIVGLPIYRSISNNNSEKEENLRK